MSEVRQVLDILNPPFHQTHEEFRVEGLRCSYCLGLGTIVGHGECPKCKGRGTMTAKVVVDWE